MRHRHRTPPRRRPCGRPRSPRPSTRAPCTTHPPPEPPLPPARERLAAIDRLRAWEAMLWRPERCVAAPAGATCDCCVTACARCGSVVQGRVGRVGAGCVSQRCCPSSRTRRLQHTLAAPTVAGSPAAQRRAQCLRLLRCPAARAHLGCRHLRGAAERPGRRQWAAVGGQQRGGSGMRQRRHCGGGGGGGGGGTQQRSTVPRFPSDWPLLSVAWSSPTRGWRSCGSGFARPAPFWPPRLTGAIHKRFWRAAEQRRSARRGRNWAQSAATAADTFERPARSSLRLPRHPARPFVCCLLRLQSQAGENEVA